MVFVSIFGSEKNQLEAGKKVEKIQKIFFSTLFAQKITERKNFDVTSSLKRSLQTPRTINEIINPIFGLGHEM